MPWIEKVGEHAKMQHTLGAAVTKLLRILDSGVVMLYTTYLLASNSFRFVLEFDSCCSWRLLIIRFKFLVFYVIYCQHYVSFLL